MRAFIAIEIPFEREFREYQDKIRDFGGFTFPNQFHLTFKFLGDISEGKLEKIKEKLKEINFKPFKAELNGLGVFPHEKHINVIWISIKPEDRIIKLQKSVEEVLENICEKEKREFKVHVTLARIKFIKDKEKLLDNLKAKINGDFLIDKFKLIKSELTPKGPIYNILEEYNGKEM